MTKYVSLLLLLLFVFSCSTQKSDNSEAGSLSSQRDNRLQTGEKYTGTLQAIKKKKVLRVLVPAAVDAAFPRKGNLLSFEKDMAAELARELGVTLELIPVYSYGDFIIAIREGRGDISMASLTITESRKERVAFSDPLDHVREILVGGTGRTIQSFHDLKGDTIAVRKSSAYYESLLSIRDSIPELVIKELSETIHTYEIVEDIAAGVYSFTLCDEDIVDAVMSYNEGAKKQFALPLVRARGWAVSAKAPQLLAYVNDFIRKHALNRSRLEKELGDLAEIKERQVLRVAVRNNAATYWIHRGKEVGFEYDLCKAFTESEGIRLEMVVVPDRESLISWVIEGRADMAASGITNTEERAKRVAFGAPYLFPKEVVVCSKGSTGLPLIKTVDDLFRYPIHLRRSSSYHETLKELEKRHGKKLNLVFVSEGLETENIIGKIILKEAQVTIADDHLARMEMVYSEDITTGPVLSEEEEIGWAVRKDAPQLKAAVDRFFSNGAYKPKGLSYNMLYNRYFKNNGEISAAKSSARADLKGEISPYDSLMKVVAGKRTFDWCMIAAQAYQESKFNPKAKSWVGAVGLMQLMPLTAKEVGVTNREDPYQSLYGGAKYMDKLLKRFDKTIPYEERYYFALASYNAGYGHLLDARKLAAQKGWNSNQWFGNVEKAMLLLAKPNYAKQARYGYCRGSEPVTYVQNIQRLYAHYSQVQ